MPIVSFRNKNLEKFFIDGEGRKIPADLREKILDLLDHLDAATTEKDLEIAKHHELKGDRKGTHAWTVTGNYRLTFRFQNGEASDVDFEDYH